MPYKAETKDIKMNINTPIGCWENGPTKPCLYKAEKRDIRWHILASDIKVPEILQ